MFATIIIRFSLRIRARSNTSFCGLGPLLWRVRPLPWRAQGFLGLYVSFEHQQMLIPSKILKWTRKFSASSSIQTAEAAVTAPVPLQTECLDESSLNEWPLRVEWPGGKNSGPGTGRRCCATRCKAKTSRDVSPEHEDGFSEPHVGRR